MLEHKVGGVDLAMRMRIGNANYLALVLEYENVFDLLSRAEVFILSLPHPNEILYFVGLEFSQRQVVPGAITDNTRNAPGRAVDVDAERFFEVRGCGRIYARMIVVKDKCLTVVLIDCPTDTSITGAEIAIRKVIRQRRGPLLYSLSDPWSVLPVRRHNNPFFPQRVPPFFPNQ
jgi:hypothetical protein